MAKVRWFVLLITVMLLLSACTQPFEVASLADIPVSIQEEEEPQLFFETQAEQGVHTECTPHKEESCEFSAQQTGDETESAMPLPSQNSSATVDKLLLDFEITFYESKLDSDIALLSDVFANGNPTVLVFWAGSCPVCRQELPDIQTAYEQYNDRVNFVGIDVGMFTNLGSRDDALALIGELELSFPLGAAMDFNVLPTYQVTAVPTTLFMKPDGQILRKENSLLSLEAIVERVDTLLEYSES